MKFIQPKLFLVFLLPICIFLTFNKHSKYNDYSYHGVIWADAAGYYVHLPIWFLYGNNAAAFPENSEAKTGSGFHADRLHNTIVTKYYCGSAILMSPFFLASHLLAKPLGYEADGFSKIYSYGIYFSGIIYCCLGLFFLSLFLKRHFSLFISVLTPLLLFTCTNLYYYSIDMPAMSHVYSFFLFSLFLYSTQQLLISGKRIFYITFALSFALAIITRPTNGLIILFPLFYENGMFLSRVKILIHEKASIAIAVFLALICLLPQLLYLNKTFGSPFSYSYSGESFSNWKNPYLLETWFSTNNGLFLYAPLLLLAVAGMILMIRAKERSGYYFLFTFLLISYLFASWWNWWFGCSLGARSFVEYYALLSFPLAYCIRTLMRNKLSGVFLFIFIGICCVAYFQIEYYYDSCFYGGTWDFPAYFKLFE